MNTQTNSTEANAVGNNPVGDCPAAPSPLAPTPGSALLDCNGREIKLGDVLKVFHFQAARRREKYYMFKHVVERVMLGKQNPAPFFKLSHLNLQEEFYYEQLNGRRLADVEIVQGYGEDGTHFKDRPKVKQNT